MNFNPNRNQQAQDVIFLAETPFFIFQAKYRWTKPPSKYSEIVLDINLILVNT